MFVVTIAVKIVSYITIWETTAHESCYFFGCFLNLLPMNCVEIDNQQKNILNCQSIGMGLIQSMVLCPISSALEGKLQ